MNKLKKIANLIFGYGISQIIVVLLPIILFISNILDTKK